jgi:hypothetical protein
MIKLFNLIWRTAGITIGSFIAIGLFIMAFLSWGAAWLIEKFSE